MSKNKIIRDNDMGYNRNVIDYFTCNKPFKCNNDNTNTNLMNKTSDNSKSFKDFMLQDNITKINYDTKINSKKEYNIKPWTNIINKPFINNNDFLIPTTENDTILDNREDKYCNINNKYKHLNINDYLPKN